MNQPQKQEYPTSYSIYIDAVEGDVINVLIKQAVHLTNFFKKLKAKENYAYAPSKWTVKQVLGHIVDTERVMSYRLMCIARGEKQDLPGFDENEYVANTNFSNSSIEILCNEFAALRQSNILLIKSLNEEELDRTGTAAKGNIISVRALVFMLAGHVVHHLKVIEERY